MNSLRGHRGDRLRAGPLLRERPCSTRFRCGLGGRRSSGRHPGVLGNRSTGLLAVLRRCAGIPCSPSPARIRKKVWRFRKSRGLTWTSGRGPGPRGGRGRVRDIFQPIRLGSHGEGRVTSVARGKKCPESGQISPGAAARSDSQREGRLEGPGSTCGGAATHTDSRRPTNYSVA